MLGRHGGWANEALIEGSGSNCIDVVMGRVEWGAILTRKECDGGVGFYAERQIHTNG